MLERDTQKPLPTLIIRNDHSGYSGIGARGNDVEAAAKRLQSYGGRVEISPTLGVGHATELALGAKKLGFSQIMVAGGDGTFREVAAGAINSGLIVGLLPTGSEEIWRREAKIPKNLLEAIDIAATGRVQRIDTGRINGFVFIFDAGIGADGSVFNDVQRPGCAKEDGKGPGRYVQAASRVLPIYRGRPASITIDGETFTVDNLYQVWVNNSQNLARVPFRRDARIDNRRFALTIISGKKLSEILLPVGLGIVKRGNTNNILFTVGSHIQVDYSQKRLRMAQGDGDPIPKSSSFDINLAPQSLLVRVPDKENELFSLPPLSWEELLAA